MTRSVDNPSVSSSGIGAASGRRAVGISVGELSGLLGGRLDGRADLEIVGLNALDAAVVGELSFIRDAKFSRQWSASRASAAVVKEGVEVPGHDPQTRALVFVRDADLAMVRALELLAERGHAGESIGATARGVHPSAIVEAGAVIDASASVGPGCFVGAGCVVGAQSVLEHNVTLAGASRLGRACRLGPGASVLAGSVLGDRVLLHAGVRIGTDGFGYRPSDDRRSLVRIPHLGNVVIDDDVEIGANSCVDRARFGSTTIGAGTKIDNLCQIAHNCRVGRGVIICGNCGIAGSATIGDGAMIGGLVGIGDNVNIGAGARVAAKSGVMSDVAPGTTVAGLPAFEGREYLRMVAALRGLARRK